MIEREPLFPLAPAPPRNNEGGTTDTNDTKIGGRNVDAQ